MGGFSSPRSGLGEDISFGLIFLLFQIVILGILLLIIIIIYPHPPSSSSHAYLRWVSMPPYSEFIVFTDSRAGFEKIRLLKKFNSVRSTKHQKRSRSSFVATGYLSRAYSIGITFEKRCTGVGMTPLGSQAATDKKSIIGTNAMFNIRSAICHDSRWHY